MSEDVDALRAEVVALRNAVRETERASVSRRRLLTGLGAVGAGIMVGTEQAAADDGDALTLGAQNTSSSSTGLLHAAAVDEPALDVRTTTSTAVFLTTDPDTPHEPASGVTRALYAVAEDSQDGLSNAIEAVAPKGFAVWAENAAPGIPAIHGVNISSGPGLAALSADHGPQILLVREDSASVGPPTTSAEAGSIRFDAAGDLWLCIATGTPGTWTRLLREDTAPGRTEPITPTRVLDTRAAGGRPTGSPAVPGQVGGLRHGGSSITLDLAGAGPIPTTARGVVGNLTVVAPSFSSHLSVGPAAVLTNTSALNFTKGAITGNAFTSPINSTGLAIKASGPASGTFHLIVDLTAFIT